MIIAEVILFLILAIGIDNIFIITNEYDRLVDENVYLSLEQRIVKATRSISPSILISFVCQAGCFLTETIVSMPAVHNFALYSATAVFINFILQLTAYISFLTIHERHFGTISKLTTEEDMSESTVELSENYFTLISKKRKINSIFVYWCLLSLIFIPTIKLGLDQKLAVPKTSYLIEYFNDIYQYLRVGPPVYFIVKNLDVTKRENQQKICAKFTTCDLTSFANILEQERSRSTITEPLANWFDDFMTFLNPDLDQCCKFKRPHSHLDIVKLVSSVANGIMI